MSGIDKKLAAKLEAFLEAGGAEILEPKNAWELARFKTAAGTHVIYQNARGGTSYSDENAHTAFTAFDEKRAWTASRPIERIKRRSVEELLIERDGAICFYCGGFDFSGSEGKPTLEHLLSISDGGNNHLSNLVLACEPCNMEAARLPIIQKVKLREEKRREPA